MTPSRVLVDRPHRVAEPDPVAQPGGEPLAQLVRAAVDPVLLRAALERVEVADAAAERR